MGLPAYSIHPRETFDVVSEISPERRYVCDSALTVDRTRDDGKSWRKLTKGLPQKNAYTQVLRHAATVNHCNNDGVYLGTTSGSIFYTQNGGNSWEVLAEHLPPIMSREAALV